MTYELVGHLAFPRFTGLRCNMMPFIQGDPASLPSEYRPYEAVVARHWLERGRIGYLTIDEQHVEAGASQRGYNAGGVERCLHVEVGQAGGRHRWGGNWGGNSQTFLHEDTEGLIANSVDGTCRVWDVLEKSYTPDGDLSAYLDAYPEETGYLMKAGEVARISIFTPHECVAQKHTGPRQFFRVIGDGVRGREPYFTTNPLVPWVS